MPKTLAGQGFSAILLSRLVSSCFLSDIFVAHEHSFSLLPTSTMKLFLGKSFIVRVKVETSVDKIYELSEVTQALANVAGGGAKGKTILKIS